MREKERRENMNKLGKRAAALLLAGMLAGTVTASAADYSKVAGASDMSAVEEVGVAGMTPINATDVADGVYEVEVETSSSMFKVEKAVLTVADGTMTADLTLSGTGYLVLYPGTGAQAAADTEDRYVGYTEGDDGAYTYTIPIPALDQPFPCAAFSKKKEQWYDRSLLVRADSLPAGAVLVELPDYEALEKAARDARIAAMQDGGEEAASQTASISALDLPDGLYPGLVTMEGGTGRASVEPLIVLQVRDGLATAQLQWSSPHYDYMLVDGVRYDPINTEGNSVFEVPMAYLDEPIPMIADTTAMSTPHEIEYAFTFSIKNDSTADSKTGFIVAAVSAVVMAALGEAFHRKERHP